MSASERRLGESAARFLRAVAREDAIAPHLVQNWEEACRGAHRHRLAPLVHLRVRENEHVPSWVRADVSEAHLAAVASYLRSLSDLRTVSTALRSMSWLTFKGPVLSASYPRPDMRPLVDLDVLVRPADLGVALEALEGAGFDLIDKNWPLIHGQMLGELHLRGPSGTVVDLHWQLLNRSSSRRGRRLSPDELIERRREVTIDERAVPTLSVPDTIVHLCVHAAASGADRLGWLVDLDRVVGSNAPNWDDVVRIADQWRSRVVTGIVLSRCINVLGTDVPSAVVDRLLGRSAWGRIERLAARTDPVSRSLGRASVSVHVARTARDGLPPSLRSGRAALREVLVRRTGQGDAPVPSIVDDRGGHGGRTAFIAAVEHLGRDQA